MIESSVKSLEIICVTFWSLLIYLLTLVAVGCKRKLIWESEPGLMKPFKAIVEVPSRATLTNRVAPVSVSFAFGPNSCASTVNATVGGGLIIW